MQHQRSVEQTLTNYVRLQFGMGYTPNYDVRDIELATITNSQNENLWVATPSYPPSPATQGRALGFLTYPIRYIKSIPFEIRSLRVQRVKTLDERIVGMLQ